jgi:hypothetical protein
MSLWQCVVKFPNGKGRMKTRGSWTYGDKADAERQAAHCRMTNLPDGATVVVKPLEGSGL